MPPNVITAIHRLHTSFSIFEVTAMFTVVFAMLPHSSNACSAMLYAPEESGRRVSRALGRRACPAEDLLQSARLPFGSDDNQLRSRSCAPGLPRRPDSAL